MFGILLSCAFWNLLVEMSESEDMVDFKILKRAGYKYGELDLAGAGWCMCLPRDGGYLPVPDSEPELEHEPDTWAAAPDVTFVDVDQVKIQEPVLHSMPETQGTSASLIGVDEVDTHA